MADLTRHEDFSERLRQNYARVYGYILSLVHDTNDAYDIFQETALALWQKYDDFQPGYSFGAWACGFARRKTLEHLKAARRRRDRAVFSEELIEALTEVQAQTPNLLAEREDALRHCLGELTGRQRELLLRCYDGKHSVRQVAEESGRTTHSVYSSMRHLRIKLLECIDRQLGTEGES